MPDTSKIIPLFDGQVEIKFYSRKHQYFRNIHQSPITFLNEDGEEEQIEFVDLDTWVKIPSTTSVTKAIFDKPELYNWMVDGALNEYKKQIDIGTIHKEALALAQGIRWKRMKEAGKIGTNIHNWIEQFVSSVLGSCDPPELIEDPKEVYNGIFGFLEWYENNVKEPLTSEEIVYHPRLDIAGTLDFKFINNEDKKEVVDFKTGNNIYPADVMQLAFYKETDQIITKEKSEVGTILHVQKDKPKVIPLSTFNHEANFLAFTSAHYLVRWKDQLKI